MAKFTAKGFSAALNSLASVPSQVAPKIAQRIAKAIDKQFTDGVDPYGRPWAPLRPRTLAKGRHPPPLTNTGAGRRSVRVVPARGAGVRITVGKGYMGIHQDGDPPRMVDRKILPEGAAPKSWTKIYQEEISKSVRAKLRGK